MKPAELRHQGIFLATAEQKEHEERKGKKEEVPYMICEYQNIRIKCASLMEAEQRARIHNEETKHSAIWKFEE